MTQMISLVDKDLKIDNITAFHLFQKLEEKLAC